MMTNFTTCRLHITIRGITILLTYTQVSSEPISASPQTKPLSPPPKPSSRNGSVSTVFLPINLILAGIIIVLRGVAYGAAVLFTPATVRSVGRLVPSHILYTITRAFPRVEILSLPLLAGPNETP